MKNHSIAFILIIFSLISSNAFAQNSAISLIGGTHYSFRTLKMTDNLSTTQLVYDQRMEREIAKINFSFGVDYSRTIAVRHHLKTGIRFLEMGYYGFKNRQLSWPSDHDGAGGVSVEATEEFADFFLSHRFIEVPLGMRSYLTQNKFSLYVEYMTAIQMYLNTKSVLDSKVAKSKNTDRRFANNENSRSILFPVILSFGVDFQPNETITLFLQTTGRFYPQSINKGTPIEERFYGVGIEIGARKSFRSKSE